MTTLSLITKISILSLPETSIIVYPQKPMDSILNHMQNKILKINGTRWSFPPKSKESFMIKKKGMFMCQKSMDSKFHQNS